MAGTPSIPPSETGVPAVHDLFDFTGQMVIVTGGGSGIGAGIALRFAEAGAMVVVHYHTSAQGAQEVVARIESMARHRQNRSQTSALAMEANLVEKDQADRLVAQAVSTFGRLDVLVNNAGIYPLDALVDMTEAAWDRVIDTNLRSVFVCTQAAARQMIAQGSPGAMVNIATIEAENPAPLHTHYNAAKAGVVMFTRSAAAELGQHQIRVNAVSPGLIWREGIEQQWPEGVSRWQAAVPLTRLGQPDDVADACLFLASPAARWITGANLVVDGGVMTHQIF